MYHSAQPFSVTLEYYLHSPSGFAHASCQLHSEGRDFIIVMIEVVKTLQILNWNYSASWFTVCLLILIAHVLSLLTNWKKKKRKSLFTRLLYLHFQITPQWHWKKKRAFKAAAFMRTLKECLNFCFSVSVLFWHIPGCFRKTFVSPSKACWWRSPMFSLTKTFRKDC